MTNTMLTLLSRRRLDETYASGHWRDDTIFSLAKAHASKSPDRIAGGDRTGENTYSELVASAEALSHELSMAGVGSGQRVAVWLSSRIETAIALIACSHAGFVCCPSLHRDHTTADIIELLNRMRAAAFVGEVGYGADAERRDIFADLDQVPTLKSIFKLGTVGSEGGGLPQGGTAERAANTDPNIVVYLAFTSGTTGRPKGVMHSDNTLL